MINRPRASSGPTTRYERANAREQARPLPRLTTAPSEQARAVHFRRSYESTPPVPPPRKPPPGNPVQLRRLRERRANEECHRRVQGHASLEEHRDNGGETPLSPAATTSRDRCR